ncbi:hypothetical protein ACSW29_21405 [Rhodococcus sp. GB-02]
MKQTDGRLRAATAALFRHSRPRATFAPPLRVLLLVTSDIGLSQRAGLVLREAGHQVRTGDYDRFSNGIHLNVIEAGRIKPGKRVQCDRYPSRIGHRTCPRLPDLFEAWLDKVAVDLLEGDRVEPMLDVR